VGAAGGPLVKVGLLQQRFPGVRSDIDLIYLLSNALFLTPGTLAAARQAGIPVVMNQNGVFYPAWYPRGWEEENARMRDARAQASHVLYQSEFCRMAAERFLGPRQGPSEILYNAVDVHRFTPSASARAPGPFRLLLTGKIGPSTGYRLLNGVEALVAARKGGLDVVLIVAGPVDDETGRTARALVAQAGMDDALVLSGPYGRTSAPDIYRAADAYLMTKHNDPCPNVVLEALSSGLPVLYSGSGGVPELVGGEAGVALPVEQTFETSPTPSPDAIAEGLARIMADREPMAVAARRRAVARFGLEAWLDRHEALFATLLAEPGT
jgi:glycosyltransferase involved in cell wall biosynthesis